MAHTTLASTDRSLEKIGEFVSLQDYPSLKAVGRTFVQKAGVIVGLRRSIPKYNKKGKRRLEALELQARSLGSAAQGEISRERFWRQHERVTLYHLWRPRGARRRCARRVPTRGRSVERLPASDDERRRRRRDHVWLLPLNGHLTRGTLGLYSKSQAMPLRSSGRHARGVTRSAGTAARRRATGASPPARRPRRRTCASRRRARP